jgi:hypothetical protein
MRRRFLEEQNVTSIEAIHAQRPYSTRTYGCGIDIHPSVKRAHA